MIFSNVSCPGCFARFGENAVYERHLAQCAVLRNASAPLIYVYISMNQYLTCQDEFDTLSATLDFAKYEVSEGKQYPENIPCHCAPSTRHSLRECLRNAHRPLFDAKNEALLAEMNREYRSYLDSLVIAYHGVRDNKQKMFCATNLSNYSDNQLSEIIRLGYKTYIKRPDGDLIHQLVLMMNKKVAIVDQMNLAMAKRKKELEEMSRQREIHRSIINMNTLTKWEKDWEEKGGLDPNASSSPPPVARRRTRRNMARRVE